MGVERKRRKGKGREGKRLPLPKKDAVVTSK